MLPQRRKSPEEIAKLRESMGIPGAVPAVASAAEPELPVAPEAAGAASESDPEPVAVPAAEPEPAAFSGPALETPAVAVPRQLWSLRKSERQPRPVPSVDLRDDAAIPIRRKSERELMELRRVQQAQPDQALAHLRQLALPWPLVALGYLLPLIGVLLGGFAAWAPGVQEADFPALWLAALSRAPWLAPAGLVSVAVCCGLAFLLAGGIALKKPRSRHHAGFVSLLALLVLVFGILQLTATHAP